METQHTPPVPGSGPRIHTIVVMIATFMLILISAFAVGLLIGNKAQPSEGPQDDDVTPIDTNDDVLNVQWYEEARIEAVVEGYYTQWISAYGVESEFGDEEPEFSARALGIVEGGTFDGYELIDQEVAVEGMGRFHVSYYILTKEGAQPVVLERYGLSRAGFLPTGSPIVMTSAHPQLHTDAFEYTDAVVPSLERHEFIEDENGNDFVLIGTGSYPEDGAEALAAAKKGMVDDNELYLWTSDLSDWTGAEQAFFIIADDGRTVWYDLVLPFWDTDDVQTSSVPRVYWTDTRSYNNATYLKGAVGGCGFISVMNVVDEPENITKVGYAVEDPSVVIFAPVDFAAEEYDDEFATYAVMNEGATREEFASIHPLFYYQDSFGRWIQFTSTEVTPPGECGKPVIYLYPETTTDISVQLAPQGGFTKTEPAYNDGWNVTANPDGSLVNKVDGLTYPYLFWEGRGGLYVAPTEYWVVRKDDVHTFLVTTLATLGLNEKETADFIEFWEPRMQAALYYQIGFYGTTFMNSIAPLTLSEQPETLLRILMDYSPLAAPIAEHPPVLPATPERNGFTVIEWGGVIR